MIKQACTLIFRLSGWKFKNNIPDDLKSFVMIGAPHTSNFDFISAMAVSNLMKRKASFVIKKEWLKFPMGLFFKPIGAIGVDRNPKKETKSISYTDMIAQYFNDDPNFVLMIAPEGTRSLNTNWKSGFYYIAQKANVPIVLAYADYEKKEAGLGAYFYPENFESDMRKIMNFYKDMKGKNPENFKVDEKFLPEMNS